MRSFSRLRQCAVALLLVSSTLVAASSSASNSTIKLLSASFAPPKVFENTNLVRNVNLDRSYPRETTNIVVKNIDSKPQSEYYYLFPTDQIHKVGGFEVKDKKNAASGTFKVELAQYTSPRFVDIHFTGNDGVIDKQTSPNSYFIIHFPEPLKPSESKTISVSYALLSSVQPLPAEIDQTGSQTITYSLSAYLPSPYTSQNQKAKLKLPTAQPADYTRLDKNADGARDPVHQGSSITYGPYNKVEAFSSKPVSVRYDFTKPLLHATKLERDIEVSLWGGNVAVEERYWLTNRAAKLKNHFSRVQWQMTRFGSPVSVAQTDIRMPLVGGASDAYFIDDIGNVSTSKFRPGRREALLDIKPRYPMFGGWNYSFKVGWNADLKNFLRKPTGDEHVLKVPFMEGPRSDAGVEYEHVIVRVVLPEGAQ